LRENSKLILDSGSIFYVSCCSRIDSFDVSNIVRLGSGDKQGKIVYEQNCNRQPPNPPGGGGDGSVVIKDTANKTADTIYIYDTLIVDTVSICRSSEGEYSEKYVRSPDSSDTYLPNSYWFVGSVTDTTFFYFTYQRLILFL